MDVIALEGNGSSPSHQGDGYSDGGTMFTLNTIEKHAVCYAIFKMKNDGNPHSGFHETFVSSTLDLNGANPNCEQGGVIIMQEMISPVYELSKKVVCDGSEGGMPIGENIQPVVITSGTGAVCYGISSYFSNAMLSDNPHSGIYEAETTRTLDLNGGNPACHQGGMVVVVYEGQNASTGTQASFTLQAGRPDDHHVSTVCYPKVTGALCANSHPGSYTGQDAFNDMLPVYRRIDMEENRKYVLRRLTPTECARLQGFPDWWSD